MLMSEPSLAEQIGRAWAEERWNRVYPWRHELPFTRPGDELSASMDNEEAQRRASGRGLSASDVYKIVPAARRRWIELQTSSGCGGYGRFHGRVR